MLDNSWHEDAAKSARILQIIVMAMVAGASIFLAIALTIRSQAEPPPSALPIPITIVAVIFIGVGFIGRWIVLSSIRAKGRREIVNGTHQSVHPGQRMRLAPLDCTDTPDSYRDAEYLLSMFQQRTILSAAMLEGWAFFATIAYLTEGTSVGLAMAILSVLGVILHFPTRSRVIAWVGRELEAVEQEKAVR